MTPDYTAIRREILAHCLSFAECDEAYARWAANDYERNPVYGKLFDGLASRFELDLSKAKAAKRVPA